MKSKTALTADNQKENEKDIYRNFLYTAVDNFQQGFFRCVRGKAGRCAVFFPFARCDMVRRTVINQPFAFFRDANRQ